MKHAAFCNRVTLCKLAMLSSSLYIKEAIASVPVIEYVTPSGTTPFSRAVYPGNRLTIKAVSAASFQNARSTTAMRRVFRKHPSKIDGEGMLELLCRELQDQHHQEYAQQHQQ